MAGRQIPDGMLIANELIDSRKRPENEGVIFNIDMVKAYDHMECSFVDYMLFQFGFEETWQKWIHECISTTSFSVLFNGLPSKLFKTSGRIRQGYPFSSFLFNLVVEALSVLLVKARELRVIHGFEINQDGGGHYSLTICK